EGRNAMNNHASPGASILSAALAMAPWDPTHYPQGAVNSAGKDLSGQLSASSNFRSVTNPFSMVSNSYPSDKNERWVGDVCVELKPFSGLRWRSSRSMDRNNNRSRGCKAAYENSSYAKTEKSWLSSSVARPAMLRYEN